MPLITAKKCSFRIIDYFERRSTAIDTTLHNTTFLILVWVFMEDDNDNNEMIM